MHLNPVSNRTKLAAFQLVLFLAITGAPAAAQVVAPSQPPPTPPKGPTWKEGRRASADSVELLFEAEEDRRALEEYRGSLERFRITKGPLAMRSYREGILTYRQEMNEYRDFVGQLDAGAADR
jgi:hypothetical protein